MSLRPLVDALVTPFRRFPRLRGSGMLRRTVMPLQSSLEVRTTRGFRMELDIRDDMQWGIYLRRTWEEQESKVLERALKRADVLFDVGANVGYFSLVGSRAVGPSGQVIAFEPLGRNRERLRRNLALNGISNVRVVEYGLADREAAVTAAVPGHEFGMASVRAISAPSHQEEIPLRRGDDLVAELSLPRPDVIKLDIEGAEFQALAGMPRVLQGARVVLVEITPPYLEELGASADAVRSLLQQHGFSDHTVVARIRCWLDDGTEFVQTNEVFARPGAITS